MRSSRTGIGTGIVSVVLAAVLGVAGCSTGGSGAATNAGAGATGSATTGSSVTADGAGGGAQEAAQDVPATLSVTPEDGATKVRPDGGVTVTAAGGRIDSVTVTAADGTAVDGELAADGTTWSSTDHLAPSATYTVVAKAGSTSTRSTFKTLRPAATAGLSSLQPGDGWVVGVGMPVVVSFDRTVKNRAAVEKALSVQATPAVEGAWRWTGTRQVQWRPKEFWPTGTKVKVVADLKGVEIAPGVWGKKTRSADFTVGSSMISTVDIAAHTMTVRRNGKVIKVIPVTTGKPGLATRNGTKVIISRETTHQMDAATTGVAQDSPEYYNLTVKYAMRLTWSGEFVHAAPWSVGSQGRANVSHGCTGMSMANAAWIFERSKVGDVVRYVNGKRKLEDGNGYTAWNMTFDEWASQSAA